MKKRVLLRTQRLRAQAGVALLMALFALMLLSAIGMGMMFSANTETMVGANYRETQLATFGAYSGIWEGRDRLTYGTTYQVTWPTAAPSTSAANVVYIINPGTGETVAPWDYTNTFADTELCQEHVLGLTGTTGVACSGSSSLPAGSAWYTTYDDSSAGATFHQSNPLPFKWARIQLKTVDAATYAIGAGSSGTIACWDGKNQLPQPGGYNSKCEPVANSVASITLNNAGSGYTSAPSVSITGGGGSGATATATFVPGNIVTSVTITNAGSGYTSAPTVVFTGGGGNYAAATAVVGSGGGVITSATYNSGSGSGCWVTPPAVLKATVDNPGSGSGAEIDVNLVRNTTSCLAGITLAPASSCSGNAFKNLSTGTTVTVTGGSGSGATFNISTNGSGKITFGGMVAGGTGYTVASPPTGISLGGNTCALTMSSPVMGYMVNTANPLTLVTGGSNYSSSSPPTISIPNSSAPTGTVGTGTTTVSGGGGALGTIVAINITDGGTGYTSAPTVSFTGGGGTGAAATAIVPASSITGINLTNAGSGYTSTPTVTLTGGGGTGATATATLSSGGTYYGQVFLVTTMGRSTAGARSMAQMEVVTPVRGIASTGALTFDGPSPIYSDPNSNGFYIIGNDANSCGQTAHTSVPAVGVYDDPNNPTTPLAATTINDALTRPDHVYGLITPGPDVENVYNTLTSTMNTPSGLEAFGSAVKATAQANSTYYGTSTSTVNLGSSSNPIVDYVNGDLTLSGNRTGYGILFVTGTLTMDGNFSWYGPVYVVGKGDFEASGGGNGLIVGTMLVANTRTSPYGPSNVVSDTVGLGSPTVNWNGGGGNGIQYDHCWVENLLSKVPFTPPQSTKPLKVLSVKPLAY